jgi:SMI1 / KNR4 family (SUKH-1)
MKPDNMFARLQGLTVRAGADRSKIDDVEKALGLSLPEDYKMFLSKTNGIEGFAASESYVLLWPLEEIAELNEAYSVSEFVRDLILLGTDGGDTGYGYLRSDGRAEFVRVPLIGMSLDSAEPMGESFFEFVDCLRRKPCP